MKKYIYTIFILFITFLCTSCLKDYLDKSPESGLNEEEVFSKYKNFLLFFDAVYKGTGKEDPTQPNNWYNYNISTSYPMYLTASDFMATWETLTETADMGRMNRQAIRLGQIEANLQWFTNYRVAPILISMFKVIRITNVALQNIPMIRDADKSTIDDIKGQAFFVRAYAHFSLFRLWGRMPYISTVIGPDDQWDIPRLSNHETLIRVAQDLDSAAYYFNLAGKMRRDPGPGKQGHLNDPEQWRPNGVAAKALRARVLLYAASPLNNEKGVADWEAAAIANWEAIQIALQYEYSLLSSTDYTNNFFGTKYTNEQIWAWHYGTVGYTDRIHRTLGNAVFRDNGPTAASAECPTQNFVDRFETAQGDPLNTLADRNAATTAGNYYEQDPYANRDPRFYLTIMYNTAPIPGYVKADIFYEMVNGVPVYGELINPAFQGITPTGYYQRKFWGGQSTKNRVTSAYTDPLIRLTELYLNYAEAANEAYGPGGSAPGATLSAIEAVNLIRTRIGMVPVQSQLTTSKETFSERIKNERTIELYGEGHHFYDIRRWKDAPTLMSSNNPLVGMNIEKVPVSAEHPIGFKHTRINMPANRQVDWKSDNMYYFPFPIAEENKMKNFEPNPRW